ncbi:unnamed protein product, partial [marine sediment metagenome]
YEQKEELEKARKFYMKAFSIDPFDPIFIKSVKEIFPNIQLLSQDHPYRSRHIQDYCKHYSYWDLSQ